MFCSSLSGLTDANKEKTLDELKVLAKLQYNEYVVQYKNAWVENNSILYNQTELCYNTLKNLLTIKRNEFKRKELQTMSLTEYYISNELY